MFKIAVIVFVVWCAMHLGHRKPGLFERNDQQLFRQAYHEGDHMLQEEGRNR